MSLWQSTLYAESAGICHGVLRTADSENTPRIWFSLMFYIYSDMDRLHLVQTPTDAPGSHAVQGEVSLEQESLEPLECFLKQSANNMV